MNRNNLIVLMIIFLVGSLMCVWYFQSREIQQSVISEIKTECNADAKICSDGSAVGRVGPKCEFAQCPSPERTEASLVTSMGQVSTAMNVSITPKTLVSDSRCPIDVECVWAGTVEVKAVISINQVSQGEQVFKLGEEKVFGAHSITLSEVNPAPKSKINIPDSLYRFTFSIKKK